MSDLPVLRQPASVVIRRHAKTFSWAARFLSPVNFAQVADLYHFCRLVDDWADETDLESGRRLLVLVRDVVEGRGDEPAELVAQVARLEAIGVTKDWLLDLVQGAESDLSPREIGTQAELERYCYLVAGVVGLMMCPVLGVRDPNAHVHAMALGEAMQLTNIARDVAEDAGRGRVYLPTSWLNEAGVSREHVLRNTWPAEARRRVMTRLLDLADKKYQLGRRGLMAIPWRGRLAVAVAARVYRHIGVRLSWQDLDPWRGRAQVSPWRKLVLTLKELCLQVGLSLRSAFSSRISP